MLDCKVAEAIHCDAFFSPPNKFLIKLVLDAVLRIKRVAQSEMFPLQFASRLENNTNEVKFMNRSGRGCEGRALKVFFETAAILRLTIIRETVNKSDHESKLSKAL